MNTYLRNIKPNAMCAQFPFTRLFDKYCLFRRAHYISAYIPHAHIKNTFRFVNNTTVMRRYLFSLLYYYYSKWIYNNIVLHLISASPDYCRKQI